MSKENVLNVINARRSIRAFKPDQIKDSELEAILTAARFAPSAMNQQLRHYTVIQNKDVLTTINQRIQRAFQTSGNARYEEWAKAENFSPFYHAPTFIIFSVDEKAIAPQCDGALSLANAFLAAEALGIGSCWIHAVNFLFTTPEGKALFKELGVPEGYIPVGAGAFGYIAGDKPEAAPRREDVVTYIR